MSTPPPPLRLRNAASLATVRRTLVLSVFIAVLLPALLLAALAAKSYEAQKIAAEQSVLRNTTIAREHALKVFDTNRQVMARIVDLIGPLSDDAIRRRQAYFHERLGDYADGISQLVSIGVFDQDGKFLVNSRFYPAPQTFDVRERDDYLHHANGMPGYYVSAPVMGRIINQPIINVSTARFDAKGNFAGMYVVTLNPKYFSDFYLGLGEEQGAPVATALLRDNGQTLAAVGTPASDANAAQAMRELIDLAPFSGARVDHVTLDGVEQIAGVSKVGRYPLYVVAHMQQEAWIALWRQHVATLAALVLLPTLALVVALTVALRRVKQEESLWAHYKSEQFMRQEVEDAYRQSRKLETLGRLSGGLAHDFNNLLMVVGTNTSVLSKLFGEQPAARAPLNALERAVHSGKRVTRQLLTFARKQPLCPERVDVRGRLASTRELFQTAVGSRIEVRMKLPKGARIAHIDGAEFDLAVLNLVVNARDAMPDGGTLQMTVDDITLDGTGTRALSGAFVQITVEDNGHGIAQEDLEKVFEPFWTTKSPGKGTGLGLSQVHGFCEQCGGAVLIESSLGVGTSVTMLLPAAPATPAGKVAARPQNLVGKRILVVEDDCDVADSTRALLEGLGCKVVCVESADSALARLMEELDHFDGVVSDVNMPGKLNGIELALRLRQLAPEMPVMLATGFTDQLELAKDYGVHVVPKPYGAQQIGDALLSLLQNEAS